MTWAVNLTLTTEDLASVVNALKARRLSMGLHQADVAKVIGCGQQHLSFIENHHAPPKVATLQAFARAVGTTLSFTLTMDAIMDGRGDQ